MWGNKKIPKRIPLLALFFLTVFCSFSLAESIPNTWPNNNFSKEEWKKTEKEKRYIFIKDIFRSNLLKDKKIDEIEILLGKPDWVSKDKIYIVYIIKGFSRKGASFAFGYDLKIYFNSKGIVENFFVGHD